MSDVPASAIVQNLAANQLSAQAPPPEVARLQTPLVLLFAVCCGISVANVYYAQPLLDDLAADFRISNAAVGGVITATQVGCAIALLLVVPLGDLVQRKRLIIVQLILLAIAGALVASAPNRLLLLGGMMGMGLLGTAMTQGLIAYAATVANPAERGRVVGAAQSGVVVGLLLARTSAGVLTDFAGWRTVYISSSCLAIIMLVVIWRVLPVPHTTPAQMSYSKLLQSLGQLLISERVLQVRGMIGLLMFAAFSIFWSALVFPLSAAPYSMSHTQIGSFGLVGAVGALAAARAGRLADRGLGQWTTGMALVCLLVSWLPLAFTTQTILALIIGIILLDLGGQAIHVVNQSMIFTTRPEAHSRLVGCYMLFYAAGSGLGAIAATNIYAIAGWIGVCGLGFTVSLAALLFWVATRRWMEQQRLGTTSNK